MRREGGEVHFWKLKKEEVGSRVFRLIEEYST
jgi:hypothetical protein